MSRINSLHPTISHEQSSVKPFGIISPTPVQKVSAYIYDPQKKDEPLCESHCNFNVTSSFLLDLQFANGQNEYAIYGYREEGGEVVLVAERSGPASELSTMGIISLDKSK